ncbi:hypothetical protein QWZ16_22350 [Vibrio ostreicida]|uniref:Uncharacterized protein n=1 Tax=Vibrio ostreicida TaxID=526588 RepID=A0ABT8BZV1_9VIBR|nr:hypothetical protein [Vibrio ostreicida]MDN3612342.1 hypothetical protein [Vibrio ostreicida]
MLNIVSGLNPRSSVVEPINISPLSFWAISQSLVVKQPLSHLAFHGHFQFTGHLMQLLVKEG